MRRSNGMSSLIWRRSASYHPGRPPKSESLANWVRRTARAVCIAPSVSSPDKVSVPPEGGGGSSTTSVEALPAMPPCVSWNEPMSAASGAAAARVASPHRKYAEPSIAPPRSGSVAGRWVWTLLRWVEPWPAGKSGPAERVQRNATSAAAKRQNSRTNRTEMERFFPIPTTVPYSLKGLTPSRR